jgi:FAD/FMN-containing dehydrogenase
VDLTEAVAGATTVVATGARTQWEVGGPVPIGTDVRAPGGIVRYEPADMTVTVGAGTSFAQLDAVLAEHGQQCPLDPRNLDATVGGIIACGLSGARRLRHGPTRDQVLEVRVVTADGRIVKGGGPTVKNVTGYDLPRLFTGSFGTLGVLSQVTLRCRPRAAHTQWFVTDEPDALYRASTMLWAGDRVHVLLEGAGDDIAAAGLTPAAAPAFPDGPCRGRISVAPGAIRALAVDLRDVAWLAELGVGTVHVAAPDTAGLVAARKAAHAHGGWMLREAGDDGADGFGRPLPNLAVMQRIKAAFDPTGKFSPGRLPL